MEARLDSPVEADESYFGGKYRNMHKLKKPIKEPSGYVGKTPVIAVKSGKAKKVKARVTKPVSSVTLQRMIEESVCGRIDCIYRSAWGINRT